MKKRVLVNLCLLFFVSSLSACDNNTNKWKKTPTNDYERVLFALNSVNETMKNPILTQGSAKGKKALLASHGGANRLVNNDIKSLLFATDRTLDDFDTNIVQYAIIFMETIGESWDEDVVYSATIPGTIDFNFDNFTMEGGHKYSYEMEYLMQVQLKEDKSVNIDVGFDVSLTSTNYGFSRYANIKIASTYDANSIDFALELSSTQNYIKTPGIKKFVAYEKMYITVNNNMIQSYEDYDAMTDRKIVLNDTYQNWQAYFDDETKFSPGAKVFDGNTVYKSHTNSSDGVLLAIVHKDALMQKFVDQVGLHEGMNNPTFFDSETLETQVLKTVESKMSKVFGKAFVYTLLNNLDNVNLDLPNTDERIIDDSGQHTDPNKSIRYLKAVNDLGNRVEVVRIKENVSLENLLLGRADCYNYNEGSVESSGQSEINYGKIHIWAEYTDNSTGYLDSFTDVLVYNNSNQPITDFSEMVLGEYPETVIGITGDNNASVHIMVEATGELLENWNS